MKKAAGLLAAPRRWPWPAPRRRRSAPATPRPTAASTSAAARTFRRTGLLRRGSQLQCLRPAGRVRWPERRLAWMSWTTRASTSIFVGAAFEIASLGAIIGPEVSVCPNVRGALSDEDDAGLHDPHRPGLRRQPGHAGSGHPPIREPAAVHHPLRRGRQRDGDGVRRQGRRDAGHRHVLRGRRGAARSSSDNSDPVFGIRFGLRI